VKSERFGGRTRAIAIHLPEKNHCFGCPEKVHTAACIHWGDMMANSSDLCEAAIIFSELLH
ncbi:MAG: hypothetical protein LAC69_02765, partial [Chlorobium sp.]|nr:hypothetical protein [Chlorobium sp.]